MNRQDTKNAKKRTEKHREEPIDKQGVLFALFRFLFLAFLASWRFISGVFLNQSRCIHQLRSSSPIGEAAMRGSD
jgi:hypothetical protein